MDVGDRLVFKVEITNVGGAWGGDSVRTVTMSYNAASGVLGDTFANFADTLAFSADSNNGRAVISERRAPWENSLLAWRLRSETALTNVTLKAGSFIRYRTIP